MADDIDDLLDEVESKFCETEPKKQALKKSSKTSISSSSGKTKTSGYVCFRPNNIFSKTDLICDGKKRA